MRKKLPIGIQTFSELIEQNYCYVDKTALIHQMVEGGKYYFLSRPRRFGKSMLISTLKSLFLGNDSLFSGLAIETLRDCSVKHPVIHISFGGTINSVEVLESILKGQLREIEECYGISLHDTIASIQFRQAISLLKEKFNQPVVILIDEYDKAILDNLVAGRDDVAIAVHEGF